MKEMRNDKYEYHLDDHGLRGHGEVNLDKYMDPQDGNIFKRNIAGQLPAM